MDTGTKSVIDKLYMYSFIAVLVFLPWSVRWCNYAFIVMVVAGLMSTSWKEKITRILAHKEVLFFVALFGLYLLGLLYTPNLALGLKSIEKKLVLLLPLLVLTSGTLSDEQRNKAQLSFVWSVATLTLACIALNFLVVSGGEPYPQVNFDTHTLARFSEFHPDANPLWMQFSYIAFGHPLISTTTVYSLYLCLSIFMLLYYQPASKPGSYLKYVAMVCFSIAVILLSSRIGIFILLSIGVFNLFQKFRHGTLRYALVSVVPILLLLLLVLSPVTRYRALEEPLNTPLQFAQDSNRWNSFNLRFLEWSSGIKGIREHGLRGTGTGGTKAVLNSYYDQVDLGDFDGNYSSNNQFLEVYLEIGIAGFLVLISCFILLILKALRHGDWVLMSLVLMTGLACISNSLFESARGLPFFIVFVSLFLFTRKKYGSEVTR